MERTLVLLLLTVCVNSLAVNLRERFPGPYCLTRPIQQCCPGRDDTCTVPIHDTVCYCDMFCELHNNEDCCPDFVDTCTGRSPPSTTRRPSFRNECIHESREYQLGSTVKRNCNQCKCVQYNTGVDTVITWECENMGCINEQSLVDRINTGRYDWTATTYSKFNGESLMNGLEYYLGTIEPSSQVERLNPVQGDDDDVLPLEFDSRVKWGDYIHPAMDQGRCAASWAFSTAGVAADRWSIQSQGTFLDQLSVQSMLSCNRAVESCKSGGKVEDAWFELQREGVVSDICYPYTSGTSKEKGQCKYLEEITCADPYVRKTTPPYRVKSDETKIMKDIRANGPVQAIIRVYPDFYLYESGVYSHTEEEKQITEHDHTLSGVHSVKIIGWGEERGVKYWLCVNSWGQRWGEDGMIKIRRGSNEIGIEDFVVAIWPRVEKHELHQRRHRHRH